MPKGLTSSGETQTCRWCKSPFDSRKERAQLHLDVCRACGVKELESMVSGMIRRFGRKMTLLLLARLEK